MHLISRPPILIVIVILIIISFAKRGDYYEMEQGKLTTIDRRDQSLSDDVGASPSSRSTSETIMLNEAVLSK